MQSVDDRCRVLDYQDLSQETVLEVAEYFGVRFTNDAITQLVELLQVNAKHPHRQFDEDSLAKQSAASDRMREAVRRWAALPYAALRERAYQPWKRPETSVLFAVR